VIHVEEQETKPAANKPEKPPKYSVDELAASSKNLFGVMPETVRGALARETKKEFTVDEVRKRVDAFLNRKVEI
jgi:hypothetical protein